MKVSAGDFVLCAENKEREREKIKKKRRKNNESRDLPSRQDHRQQTKTSQVNKSHDR